MRNISIYKSYFFIFIIVSLFSYCKSLSTNERRLKIQVNNIVKFKPENSPDSSHLFYSINIDMTNYTDTIICFVQMSCGWEENFIFDTKAIDLFGGPCDSNVPVQKKILPGQTISFKGIIIVNNDSISIETCKCKLGFVLINRQGIEGYKDFQEAFIETSKGRKNIFWSDPFESK